MDLGIARRITVEEGLKIPDRADEAGLVTQPGNNLKPGAIFNRVGIAAPHFAARPFAADLNFNMGENLRPPA